MASDPEVVVSEASRPRGRPEHYQEDFAEEAYRLALLGHTDMELADHFEVSLSAIERWKRKKLPFRRALARGRSQADGAVAEGLYNRARGFTRVTTRFGKGFDNEGNPRTYEAEEYYPPDVAAASLWLRNRQGGKWRDKTDVQHSGTISLEAWVIEATPPPAKLEQARVIEHSSDDIAKPDHQEPLGPRAES